MSKHWRAAFCPVCFRTMGIKADHPPGKPWMRLGETNLWEQPDKFAGQALAFWCVDGQRGPGHNEIRGALQY